MFQVNGISLVGVSQKLAAQTLSNCAICPETGQWILIIIINMKCCSSLQYYSQTPLL